VAKARLLLLVSVLVLGADQAYGEDPPPFAFEWALDFSPGTISIDPAGNLWFMDFETTKVHRARRDGNPLDSRLAGGRDLACDLEGNAFVLIENDVRLLHADGILGCGGILIQGRSIAVGVNGETFGTEIDAGFPPGPKVARIHPGCVTEEIFDLDFEPGDIAVGGDGTFFLVDESKKRLVHYDGTGLALATWRLPSDLEPISIAMHPDGNLLAGVGQTVYKYGPSGDLLVCWGNAQTFASISGLAVNALGDVYVCDSGKNRIRMYGIRQPDDNPPVPPTPPPPPPPPPPPLTSHPAAILLHFVPASTHTACNELSSLGSVITYASVSPDDAHHSIVYMVATPDMYTYQICGVQAGIAYDATREGHPGLEVLSWHACSDLEFPGDTWPGSGSGNTTTWADNYSTDINVVGYFEVIARGAATMSVIPWPNTGMAKIANCSAMEYALQIPPDRLGWVSWGGAGFGLDTDGCNPVLTPCGHVVATNPSTWGRLKNLYRQ